MAKQKYDLLPGECVILKTIGVSNGFWSGYNDELVLTNKCIIWVKRGTFGNFKGVVRFPLSKVTQAIIGKSSNGVKQLEVYHSSGKEDFEFQSRNDRELRVWSMAIADRFKEDSNIYDYNYYQNFLDDNLQVVTDAGPEQECSTGGIDGKFIGDVAKSVLKSGNLSVGGVMKGVQKTSAKQARRSVTQGLTSGLKDELGITEIQDEFTEIGNEFREAFGLKPKTTQKEKKEQQLNVAFNQKVADVRQEAQVKINDETVNANTHENTNQTPMSLDEQIETMKKLKELLDVGILSQEEFDLKKKEIMRF
ncbi:MAG: SHOCT domain-containing protein [Anaerovoracaceae bacterium]